MSWLFGKKKAAAKPTTNDSINKMNDHVSLLQKREALLEKKIQQEVDKAKEYLKKGNKNAATLCMKRKKNYEAQVQRLHAQMTNLESMGMKLEEASIDVETIKAQKEAATTLKQIYKTTNVDKIEEDMDKVREAIEDANDISNALAQPLGTDTGLDDDELLDELNQLEQEEMDKQMLGMPSVSKVSPAKQPVGKTAEPTPAKAAPAAKAPAKTEEDENLAALEAELNM